MENKNENKIQKLKEVIVNKLTPLIKSDYVLLDTPCHGNIGDQLIFEGELIYLREYVENFKCLYSANTENTDYKKIPQGATILLHGGGNFGDIYDTHQKFRLEVIEKFPNNPIIILPQTVFYNDLLNLEHEANVLNAHSNLYICLRDSISYELLNRYISPTKLLLLPDMAFFIDLRAFYQENVNKKLLIMDRIDIENTNRVTELNLIATLQDKGYIVDLKDWPTYYKTLSIVVYNRFNKIRALFFKHLPFFKIASDKNDKILKDHYSKMGIEFMNKYDIIYTTRLHGLILAILLNKEVTLLDNNYGKLASFYETWLSDFDNVTRI